MMNKLIQCSAIAGVAAAFLAVVASPASGQGTFPNGTQVSETLHNLQRTSLIPPMDTRIENYGEICVYCHVPHAANAQVAAPLWNRNNPAGPYTMYTSSTIDMATDPSPSGVSLACLSCHDGTVGLDVILNPPNSYTGTGPLGATMASCAGCHSGSNPPGGFDFSALNFGTDLSNDHPVSITYDPTADPNFHAAADVEAAGLVLYSGKVQCGSCHNPHSAQWRPFLRIDNAGSAMCLTCHIK